MSEPGTRVAKSALTYAGLRLAMAAVAFALCLVVGLAIPISVVIAFVASSIGAFVLLAPQREQLADSLVARRQAKLAARNRRRDALGD